MPLPVRQPKFAYHYEDGPSFTCPICEQHIHGSDDRIWFPTSSRPHENKQTFCNDCGTEICDEEDIRVVMK